jgi:hypothetical protein
MKRRVMFTFTQENIREPVIFNLGHDFNLVTNIRRAALSAEEGWIVLDLEGEEHSIEQGLTWVTSKGVRVNPINGDAAENKP